jgi:hypothetical protein
MRIGIRSMKSTDAKHANGYWRAPDASGLPAKSGIYGVYACVHNTQGETVTLKRLLYLGEAANVQERVANHEK